MKTVNELKSEISVLWNQLKAENQDEIVLKVKAIEKQIQETRIIDRLDRVNKEQQRKRELALLAWNAEQPTEDITTISGTFHATKVKKYPKLAALPYCTANFEDGKIKEIKLNGERFNMFKSEYKSGELHISTKYTRPDTFAEFLKLNSIIEKDIELNEFKELIEKSEAINKEFKAATEKFDSQKSELNMYFYSGIGLFSQQNAGYIYKFVLVTIYFVSFNNYINLAF